MQLAASESKMQLAWL